MHNIYLFGIIFLLLVLCHIWRIKYELFTNIAGYYTNPTDCNNMTLRDCLSCSTCSWCMGDNFSPKCVAGQASDLLKTGQCQKVYSNDVFTRALLSGDNSYINNLNLPIID